jgi:GNAT superfamily N-acetyltransferase
METQVLAAAHALPTNLQDQGFETAGIDSFGPEEVIAFVDRILWGDCQMDARKQLERSVTKFFTDFDDGRRFFLAITREGQLCGFTAIDRYNDRTATLKWIFVTGEFRGRKMGSWLLDAALSFAMAAGYEKAILCTATKMEAAHRLYRNKGFVFKQWVTFWKERMQVYENVLVKSDPE